MGSSWFSTFGRYPALAVLWARRAASVTSRTVSPKASRRSWRTATSYCGSSPPIATTCATPGTARSFCLSSNSARLRTSSGDTRPSGEDSAKSITSPVMLVIGMISACVPGGSSSRTAEIRSDTNCLAR